MALVMSVGFTNAQNIQQIREKADKGDAYSQYLMGYSYNNGINGAVIDYAQARSWFKRSAENGYGAAAYFMGWYYYYGEGVTKNIPEALKWFTKAQNLGMTDAKVMVEACKRNASSSSAPVIEDVDDFDQSGTARKCVASVLSADVNHGLELDSKQLPTIAPGEKISVTLPVKANLELATGKADLVVQVNEPHGLGSDPIQLSVNTKQFSAPKLQVVDYAITSANGNKLSKKQPFDMQVLLQNLEYGTAEDVVVEFSVPYGVLITSEGGKTRSYSSIGGGATKSLDYSLIVSDNFKGTTIPIDVNVHEKYGKYAQNKRIELKLNQTLASNKIEVQEKAIESKSFTIETASLTSDVDKNIPEAKSSNADNICHATIELSRYDCPRLKVK